MRNKFLNPKGYLAVNCLMVGTIILIFTMSTYSIFVKDYYVTLSNVDGIKANYLAETAIDEGIMSISESINAIVIKYLEDLRDYKMNYLRSLTELEEIPSYFPPKLEDYLQIFLINRITDLNQLEKNPFLKYTHQHDYKINFSYNQTEKMIYLEGIGQYNNTRKRIQVIIEMPKSGVVGLDCFGLKNLEIYPMKVISYYQEIFK